MDTLIINQKVVLEEARIISLPYHCMITELHSEVYYRINKDRSFLKITLLGGRYAGLVVANDVLGVDTDAISKATPCDPERVQEAKNKALEFMDNVLTEAI